MKSSDVLPPADSDPEVIIADTPKRDIEKHGIPNRFGGCQSGSGNPGIVALTLLPVWLSGMTRH